MDKPGKLSRRVPEEKAASEEEVVAAIEALTPEDLRRLNWYARKMVEALRRKSLGRDAKDLLQEAVTATLARERLWNKEAVDFVGHLLGVVRSTAWAWRRRFDADEPYLESEVVRTYPDGKEVNPMVNATSPALDARRVTKTKDHLDHIETLLAGRPLAVLIVAGLRDKMTGPEIKEELGISQTELETEMKWVRRTVRADRNKEGNSGR